MVHLRQSGRRWRRHLRWLKRKRREDRNRAAREGPESAHSGTQAASLGSAEGVAMSRPARGTMAHFCRRGRFLRAHGGKLVAVPGGLDDLSPTVGSRDCCGEWAGVEATSASGVL